MKSVLNFIINFFANTIGKLLNYLHLQLAFILALVWLVLYIVGVFDNNVILSFLILILIALSVLGGLYYTLKSITVLKKDDNKKGIVQVVSQETVNQNSIPVQPVAPIQQEPRPINNPEPERENTNSNIKYPIYYRVKQDSRYIYAEYENRYELYLSTKSGYKKIRTDYK